MDNTDTWHEATQRYQKAREGAKLAKEFLAAGTKAHALHEQRDIDRREREIAEGEIALHNFLVSPEGRSASFLLAECGEYIIFGSQGPDGDYTTYVFLDYAGIHFSTGDYAIRKYKNNDTVVSPGTTDMAIRALYMFPYGCPIVHPFKAVDWLRGKLNDIAAKAP